MIVKILDKLNTMLNVIRLKILYGNKITIGKNINIRGKLYIRISKNGLINIGDNCFFNNNCSINAKNKILIGNDCLFGENVKIYDHNHIYNINKKIKDSGYNVGNIEIKDNCWICSNAVILKGTIINNNSVVSANTIVNREIESDQIVFNDTTKKIIKRENK